MSTTSQETEDIQSKKHVHKKSISQNPDGFFTTLPRKPKSKLPPVTKPKQQKKHQQPIDVTSDDISEITNSDYHESMLTSKSDMQSYREMIRDRFLSKKQQSMKSLEINQIKTSKKDELATSLRKSVEHVMRKNHEIDQQMEHYKKPRIDESERISSAMKYHFFCENAHDELIEVGEETKENGDNKEDVEDGSVILNKKAEYLINEIISAESEMFYYPTKQSGALEDLDEDLKVREDGIYVPEPTNIPAKHLRMLKIRLADDSKWLNSSNQIIFAENPYSKTSFRPENYSSPLNIELEFCKPETEYTDYTLESILIPEDYLLEINIQSLKFHHHHLFSFEHVLQAKLIKYYDIHRNLIVNGSRERAKKKLESTRKRSSESLEVIKACREKFFEENKLYRENIKNIITTWKCIKKTRETNKFSNTNIKLIIRKENFDYELEKGEYTRLFEEFYEEILNEFESDYEEKWIAYKEELNKWKQIQSDDDEEIRTPKPKKPVKEFDPKNIRDDLKKNFNQCFKPPGEPELQFSITYENDINKVIDESKEIARRNAVNSTKLFLKLFCNEIEICKSQRKKLTDNFLCIFEESFNLKLINIPEHVHVELWEQNGALNKRKLDVVKIKIPNRNSIIGEGKFNEYDFSTEEIVNGIGVGSGMKVKEFPGETFTTKGVLTTSISWSTIQNKPMVSNPESLLYHNILDNNGVIDVKKLNNWIDDVNLDPQDPKNAVIFDYIRNYSNKPTPRSTNKYFQLDPHLHSLVIGSKKELEENVRFKLLQLRDNNEPEFVESMVPNRLKEIPSNVFSAYNRRLAEENMEEYLQEDDYENEINSRRSYGRKYLRQVHTKIFQMCRNAQNNLTFEDVVNEQTVSLIEMYIKTVLSNMLNWFRFSPRLSKPLPRKKLHETETEKIIESNAPPKIVIKLIGGVNMPFRLGMDAGKEKKAPKKKIVNPIKPFVEITYQKMKVRSNTSDGSEPVWNEDIKLPLETTSTNYLSPAALNGSINLNLFDELDGEDDYDWLGSIQIPVSAICQHKLEGLFLVQTPAKITHYEQSHELQHISKSKSNTNIQNFANYTYIQMKVLVEPNVPKLSPDMKTLPCSEPPFLRDHILEWNEKFNTEQLKRKFSALAIDTTGKTVCVTRFIKPLEPPQINSDGFYVTPEQCARFVSLIPFTDCNHFYQNMWLTTELLLKLGLGSTIDHAVALTCYFLSLQLEVWLALGVGIPHGTTAFVLVREYLPDTVEPLHFVYDVTTGFKYNVLDKHCPLLKIFCVINDSNVWANIQRGDKISTTRFDFTRRFDWNPLFNNHIAAPTNSIQQKLLYISNYDAQNLQMVIEKKLRKRISKVRSQERTIWNHYLSATLKKALSKYETNLFHGKSQIDDIPELEEFLRTGEVNVYIINVPFSKVASIVEKITHLKLLQVSNVEFATGVWVFSYPNQIISVWVALGTINKT